MNFETDMNSDLSTKPLSITCRKFKNTGNKCASLTYVLINLEKIHVKVKLLKSLMTDVSVVIPLYNNVIQGTVVRTSKK